LARALVANPQLLVLDEAVSALDAATRNEILRLILALWASRGLGFLLVSHDLSVIRSVTDRICVLAGGVIVEEGATDAVLSQPEHPYTRQLVAATPTLFPLGTSTSRNDHDDPV
jgi:peptide/nickel transport system ATP-binding protein